MAVDESLLECVAERGQPTLRFYQWSEPTLSLGYFQRYADRLSHEPSRDCPAVRRSTGGGALVHHHELTYSLVLPPGDPLARDAVALTCLAHKALIDAIEELVGVSQQLTTCGDAIKSTSKAEPFLCFQRRSQGDVIVSNTQKSHRSDKVCGSAQRRRRGAMLQHGGVILERSPQAPEISGLGELLQQSGDILLLGETRNLAEIWGRMLLQSIGLRPVVESLTECESEFAQAIQTNHHSNQHWLKRR